MTPAISLNSRPKRLDWAQCRRNNVIREPEIWHEFQDRNSRYHAAGTHPWMFNLNDPRWGRGEDKAEDGSRPEPERPPAPAAGGRGRDSGPTGQPPDLDELWRDLNRKLGGLFGNKNGGSRGPGGGNGGGFQPDMKSAGVGIGHCGTICDLDGDRYFYRQKVSRQSLRNLANTRVRKGLVSLASSYPIERANWFCDQIRSADVGRTMSSKAPGCASRH